MISGIYFLVISIPDGDNISCYMYKYRDIEICSCKTLCVNRKMYKTRCLIWTLTNSTSRNACLQNHLLLLTRHKTRKSSSYFTNSEISFFAHSFVQYLNSIHLVLDSYKSELVNMVMIIPHHTILNIECVFVHM